MLKLVEWNQHIMENVMIQNTIKMLFLTPKEINSIKAVLALLPFPYDKLCVRRELQ